MSSSKQKTFRFFCARFLDNGQQLQDLLVGALHKKRVAFHRREAINDIEQEFRLINSYRTVSGCTCGSLFGYTVGQNQAVVNIDETATELSIAQVAPPPSDKSKRNEFIEGILFFAVYKNDVVLVASQSMTTKAFQDHLNWLITEASGEKPFKGLLLVDPESKLKKNTKLKAVKSISFSADVPFVTAQTKEQEISRRKVLYKPEGPMWKALTTFLEATGIELPHIDFRDSVQPGELQVEMEISRTVTKDTKEEETFILDPLANAFSHSQGVDFTLNFKDGSSLKGDDLRIQDKKSVACTNGIPDMPKLFTKMVEWLEYTIARDDIDRG